MNKYRYNYLFITLIVTAATVALFFKIGDIPPLYPWSDESEIAADAVATLKSGPQLFYPNQLAGGSLAVWLEAAWMSLFGRSLAGLRVFNGLLNILSAVLLYLLVCDLPLNLKGKQQFVALAAALLFAVSTWLLGMGRIATPNWSLVPLLTTLTYYCFWRGWQTSQRRYFALSGLVMGLLFYGYIPGYFVPLTLALFLATVWLTKRLKLPMANLPSPLLPTPYFLLPFLIALLVAAPILIFLALNPVSVLQRPLQLADTNQLASDNSMLQGVVDMLSTFGFYPNWLWQGRWESMAFDPLVTILFVLGALLVLWRWRQAGYLFLLLWWGVMIAPALLSRSASLGFIFEVWRRGIGAQPVSFILVAIALQTIITWPILGAKSQKSESTEQQSSPATSARQEFARSFLYPMTIIGVTVFFSAGLSYWLYFGRWANSGVIPLLFAESPVGMVEWMTTVEDDDTLFIFPIRPDVSPTTRPELFTVLYLYDGSATITLLVMDETLIAQSLSDVLAQQPTTVILMMSDRVEVDPKGYFGYALALYGDVVGPESWSDKLLPNYQVTIYQKRSAQGNVAPLAEANTNFGDVLQLVRQQIPTDPLTAGQSLNVALRWVSLTAPQVDYNVGLVVDDAQGYEVTKVNKALLSQGDYATSQHWLSGNESTQYYTLALPAETPPGTYLLRVVVYNVDNGQQLTPVGGETDLSLKLAEVEIGSSSTQIDAIRPQVTQPVDMTPVDVTFPNRLRLAGFDNSARDVYQPGDSLRVTLWWQATQPLSQDVSLMLALAKAEADPRLLFEQPQPLIVDYPSSVWPEQNIYRVNYRVLLPVSLSSGDYQLALGLFNPESAEPIGEQLLFPLTVEARTHIFEAAALANEVNLDFGDVIRLKSFEFESGAEIKLHLQWQALDHTTASYKIFLHLLDENNQIVAQVDTLPQQGGAPTTGWVADEIIKDVLSLSRPTDLSSTAHRLVIGWYDKNNGERLPTIQGDSIVLVENIE